MNRLIIIPLAFLAASCTVQVGDDGSSATTSSTRPSTTVTTTTSPPTTVYVPPPPPPPVNAGITVADCPPIGDNITSEYFPSDWDVWCAGWLFGEQYIWDNPEVCEAFWEVPDSDIMEMWMADGNDRDFAIGALDSLWMTC